MSMKTLPPVPVGRPQVKVRTYVAPSALARWDPTIHAASDDDKTKDADDRTIGIFDVIGEDWWTGAGFTDKRMAAALRALGKGPVTVSINSPGGDMFQGLAMYSMLREHPGEVTVKVMGLAASAASLVAMAGDKVEIARAGFFMIHDCWILAEGNRHDLRDLADQLEPFDAAMADIYAARTGEDAKAMGKLMDRESWIGGSAAVSQGFADSLLASDEVSSGGEPKAFAAARRMECALRAAGMSKVEAMRLISEFRATARDAGSGNNGGSGDPAAGLVVYEEAFSALRGFSLSTTEGLKP
jgi:ATP-dependent Clp protease protease subunit